LGLLSFLSVTVVCAFFLAAILAERKRAEEALAEQMILHTSIVNSTSDLIWSVEATRFTMLSFNRALQLHCQARNIPLATGMTLEGHLLQDEPVGQWRRFYQQAISEGGCSTEYSSGKESPVYQIQFNLLKQAERLFGISVFAKNVTSQRLLEAQLRQAQKMEAVGQLAGGVAHDFNNMLAAMMMNLDLLRDHPGLTPEVHEGLTELENEAKRAAGLTRQLLMFSRRSILEKRALNLNEVIANLKNMLSRLLGENIQLAFEPDPLLPPVEADSGMLEQVLMNLVVNARDAMPVGGRIRIATQTAEFNAEQAAANPDRTAGRFACLLVSDTGCGMDAATLKRIFEPFFTTKASGKGTGLGLATVYGIVVQHKGWVEVESRVGAGTAFRVFLPAMAGTPAKTGSLVSQPAPTGKETILVVEDALNLRRVLVQSLRGLGYRVLEAANGQEAMNLWHTHGVEIDLLFTDMVMPEGMTGLELAERVRAEKAGLKIIISSGYSAEITNLEKIVAAGITYLPKPYPVPQLGTVVRECLDGK
jgi:signal transduction histidine kinase